MSSDLYSCVGTYFISLSYTPSISNCSNAENLYTHLLTAFMLFPINFHLTTSPHHAPHHRTSAPYPAPLSTRMSLSEHTQRFAFPKHLLTNPQPHQPNLSNPPLQTPKSITSRHVTTAPPSPSGATRSPPPPPPSQPGKPNGLPSKPGRLSARSGRGFSPSPSRGRRMSLKRCERSC